MRKLYYLPLCVAVLALGGCKKDAKSSDAREERDPLVKTGQAYMEQRQWKEAEQAFKQALENDPTMARPHLDLAMIYQQHMPNYIHAIYHYDRYLELRPDSEKTEMINDQKLKVAQALANAVLQNSPQTKELKRLQQENATLKQQLAEARQASRPVVATPTPTVAQTAVPAKTEPAVKTTGSTQIYHVVAGDTLTKIATRFYGDAARWDVIFEANKDTLPSPSALKVGQTLVIPVTGN